jgi:fluoroacetyl-CoA thioesterase
MYPVSEVIRPGMYTITGKTVEKSDTAENYGGGSLGNLLATPAYVGLIIKGAVDTIDPLLPEGLVSVGRSMHFTHDAPTFLGMTIKVKAVVKEVNGNHILFDISAFDDRGEVGHGQHERAVVRRDSLLQKANDRLIGI